MIGKLLISALAVILAAYILPGVDVDPFWVAIIVAFVLGILNVIVKPILIILTIPVTIITLGLFLLVINAVIILLTDALVPGFHVDGFLTALLFSVILSILQWFIEKITEKD